MRKQTHLSENSKIGQKMKKNDRKKHQHQILLLANKLNDAVKKNLLLKEMIFELEPTNPNASDDKIFVSQDKKFAILKQIHDQSTIDHFGIKKILQLMQLFFH